MKLFTIGHSNHQFSRFVELLEASSIDMVIDVRSLPRSRFNPQFDRETLERALLPHGIEYAFAGQFLGGRPRDPGCYKARVLPAEGADYLHEVDYPEVMKRDWFRKGIERLVELTEDHTATVMCSEENPAECHRHHLIYKYLRDNYSEIDVRHIRGDGKVIGAGSILASVNPESLTQPSLF